MREAEQRLTEEQETMLGLQVPTNPPFCPKFVTPFLGPRYSGGFWVGK